VRRIGCGATRSAPAPAPGLFDFLPPPFPPPSAPDVVVDSWWWAGSSDSEPRWTGRLARGRDGRGRWMWPQSRRICPPVSISLHPLSPEISLDVFLSASLSLCRHPRMRALTELAGTQRRSFFSSRPHPLADPHVTVFMLWVSSVVPPFVACCSLATCCKLGAAHLLSALNIRLVNSYPMCCLCGFSILCSVYWFIQSECDIVSSKQIRPLSIDLYALVCI
jgi:hypothetical protein